MLERSFGRDENLICFLRVMVLRKLLIEHINTVLMNGGIVY